jgi:hypothetical protein
VIPDLIPEGYMTDVEVGIWSRYYERRERAEQMNRQLNRGKKG